MLKIINKISNALAYLFFLISLAIITMTLLGEIEYPEGPMGGMAGAAFSWSVVFAVIAHLTRSRNKVTSVKTENTTSNSVDPMLNSKK